MTYFHLTERQQDTLLFIEAMEELNCRSPSLSEIGRRLGVDRTAAARVVRELTDLGFIARANKPLRYSRYNSIRLLHRSTRRRVPKNMSVTPKHKRQGEQRGERIAEREPPAQQNEFGGVR